MCERERKNEKKRKRKLSRENFMWIEICLIKSNAQNINDDV